MFLVRYQSFLYLVFECVRQILFIGIIRIIDLLRIALNSYYKVCNKNKSFLGVEIKLPQNTEIDRKLLLGSALFGMGWGLAGLCPGPAISSLVFLSPMSLLFLAAMFAGVLANKYI